MMLNPDLVENLRQYVRKDQPFGPPDAADIKEPACAAALFDWNNLAFAELLTGSDVLVGRRGSGKSALLSTFRGKRYLKRDLAGEEAKEYRERFRLQAKVLTAVPDIIVEADTPALVDEFEEYCQRRHAPPPVEVMARLWNIRIWMLVGSTIRTDYEYLWREVPSTLQDYITNQDVLRMAVADESYAGRMRPEAFVSEMEVFLKSQSKRCVITFDNIERYKFSPMETAVLAGLIAATGKMIGAQHPSLDVKLCLPAEVFEHLKTLVFRADKDFHKVQFLHWNTSELMHLAASRLKVFFQLHDHDAHELVKDLRLTDRATLRRFWNRFLPDRITNSVGIEEDTFTYLLRHTQLLPRQLLTALNSIARRGARDGRHLFQAPFGPGEIIGGIEDTEDANAQAVLAMYEPMYPLVREMFDLVMPRLRRVFDYGFLHSVYNSSGRPSMEAMHKGDFRHFWRLMLSTGAIGVLDQSSTSDKYATAKFEFNTQHTLKISDKDQLCVHPMFSRIYNIEKTLDLRIVLPRGSDFGIDRD